MLARLRLLKHSILLQTIAFSQYAHRSKTHKNKILISKHNTLAINESVWNQSLLFRIP